MRPPYVAYVLLTFVLLSRAAQQSDSVTRNTRVSSRSMSSKTAAAQPEKAKFTDEQKRGWSLLEAAEASAGALEAPSRIVAYTQISGVYRKTSAKKAIELLQQAYEILRMQQFDSPNSGLNAQLKYQLQQQVLNQFVSVAPERVDALIDGADPAMRQEMLRGLLPYYKRKNNLDRPVSILMQLSLEAEMPYDIVDDVMAQLAPSHTDQISQLFLASLSSYQNHEHLSVSADTSFANLISKAYGKVPDETVETAIDELLTQARKVDEKNANVSISMGFEKGALQFKSIYDTQLFAVLPTLQAIDPGKADRLLKQSEDVNTFASKYPHGMNSLSTDGRPSSMGVNTGNAGPAIQSSHLLEEQQVNAAMKEAEDHPNDALAHAAALQPQEAVNVYLNIAHANVKKDTTVANAALGKALDLLPQTPTWDQLNTLSDIIRTYEGFGDKQRTQGAFERGAKILAAMYKQESDADDPNLAPKAYWISTVAWRKLIALAYALNPAESANLLQAVPDDELRVFVQIALAKSMLGSNSLNADYSLTAHKNGTLMSMMPAIVSDESK